MSKLR